MTRSTNRAKTVADTRLKQAVFELTEAQEQLKTLAQPGLAEQTYVALLLARGVRDRLQEL